MNDWRKQRRIKRLRDMRNKHHDYCINSLPRFFPFHNFNKVEPEKREENSQSMHVGKKDIPFETQAE